MKKLITMALCAIMAFSFAACTNTKTPGDNSPKQPSSEITENNDVEIPNPFVDCETIADAEKLAGLTVILPKTIPDGYTQKSIKAIKDDLVQIIYENEGNQIVFRQAKGSHDISGDTNEYKENNTVAVGNLNVTFKGNGGKVNVATWVSGEHTFAISFNPGGDGLDNQVINDMISSMENNGAGIGDVEIPSPFVSFETLAEAEKLAGFDLTLPSKMPETYTQKSIEAIENEMIQILFGNGENTIVIRKAKGSDDISGDNNEYSENNTLTVGGLQVAAKGNNGKVNVATWVDGEYTYAVSVGFDETGLDAADISDMVSGIR